jgi:hypothetical protein
MHYKSDKLSLIKLNLIDKTSFFRSKYAREDVTYRIFEVTQMHGISSHKVN